MSEEATIGTRNREGFLEITDTNWDSNGTMRVTVRDLTNGERGNVGGIPSAAMRRLARRALVEYYPGQTRSCRVLRKWHANGCFHVTFAVSRLDS